MPKINATSLGRKTNATFKNFVNLTNFSVKITDLALTFFPREKNQCHFQKFRQIDEFFTKIMKIQKTFTKDRTILCKFNQFHTFSSLSLQGTKTVYLANYVEILLHDHFSGCIKITNPLGLIYIPRGFVPWDEMSPSGLAILMHPSK